MATNEQFPVTPQTSAQITQQTSAAGVISGDLHDLEVKRARHYLAPSLSGLMGYFIAALALLALLNISNILAALNSTLGTDPKHFTEAIKMYTDNPIVSWATIILFWGSVGLAVYTLFWLGSAFITAARNEMVVETAFSRRGHFWEKIRVPLIKVVLIVGVVIAIALSLNFSIPALSSFGANAIFYFSTSYLGAAGYLAVGVFGAMVNLYVVVTLITFFRHAEGIF